jgi:DNA-binding CsgD family transcriptional regulator
MSPGRATDGFVGRAGELALLQGAFEDARRSEGRIVAVRGDAGIGKTRLVEEFCAFASADGGRVLWGRAQEVAGAPPYWPWIEVIRGLRVGSTLGDRRTDAPAPELAHLLPELSEDVEVDEQPHEDPERTRWRLLEGVSAYLWSGSGEPPMVIVLDDLHWADHSTLLLLQHFARGVHERPILLVVMYRGEPLTAGHPLTTALAALGRLPGFRRIELPGLTIEEVAAFLAERLDMTPSSTLVEAATSRTGGSPFFLRELAAFAERSGDPGEIVTGLPYGAREAAAARLGVVTDETREVLDWTALLGDEFGAAELTVAAGRAREQVLDAIEDAQRAGLLVETLDGERYRFAHALMRDAWLARLTAARRAELHAQIAERLEAAKPVLPIHPERLAYHYSEALEAAPQLAPKAIEYRLLAAERARRLAAWGDAAGHYKHALAVARRDPALPAAREAEFLVSLARVENANNQRSDCARHYRDAIDRYRRAGERIELARTTLAWLGFSPDYPSPDERRRVARDALSALGTDDEPLRARLLTELLITIDEIPEAAALAAEARSLASRHGLPDIDARIARWEAHGLYRQRRWDDYRAQLLETAQKFSQAGDRVAAAFATFGVNLTLFFQGRFDDAITAFSPVIAAADRRGNAEAGAITRALIATMETQRGDRERAHSLLRSSTLGPHEHAWVAIDSAYLAELEGDLPRARQLLDDVPREGIPNPEAATAARARLALIEGDEAEARREIARWEPHFEEVRFQLPGLYYLALLDGAVTLLPPHRREALLEDTARWDGLRFAVYGSFDRLRGVLALSLDRLDEAEQRFRIGRDWALREHCEAEAGRCELGLADVAERRNQHEAAARLVGSALERLKAHGGVLDVRRAQERLDQLRGGHPEHGGIDHLTARELEVLQHLAAGETNAQIAERLVISPHTAANHVKSILAKTACANRAEAAAYAVAHSLVQPRARRGD